MALEFFGSMVPFEDAGAITSLSASSFNARAVPGAPATFQIGWPVYAEVQRELTIKLSGGHARVVTPQITGCSVRVLVDPSSVFAGPSWNRLGTNAQDAPIVLPGDALRPDAAQALVRVGWSLAGCYAGPNQHLQSFGLNLGPGGSADIPIPPHAHELELCEDRVFGLPIVEWVTLDNQVCPATGLGFRRVFVPTDALAVRVTNPPLPAQPGRYLITFRTHS